MQIVVFFFIAKLVDPGTLPQYGGTVPTLPRVRRRRPRGQPDGRRPASPGRGLAAPGAADRARSRRCSRRRRPARRCSSARSPTRCSSSRSAPRSCSSRSRSASASTCSSSGVGPALLLLLCFLPFTWGLGLVSAAVVVTFRRGANATGMVVTHARPDLRRRLPDRAAAGLPADDRGVEPVRDRDRRRPRRADRRHGLGRGRQRPAAARRRSPLLGLALGVLCFRAAVARERRRGTLGHY